MTYYYLVSSLPLLDLGGNLPLSPENFFTSYQEMLVPGDRVDVRHIIQGDMNFVHYPFIMEWLNYETQLRNALVRVRGERTKISADPYLFSHTGYSLYAEKIVVRAMRQTNPLKKELILDQFRWALLEELSFPSTFEISTIFSYILKLKLAARWSGLSDEKGLEAVNKTVNDIVESMDYGW